MSYVKQTWNTTSYVNPTRMNHIEDGIEGVSNEIDNLDATNIPYDSNTSVKEKIDEVDSKTASDIEYSSGVSIKQKIDDVTKGVSVSGTTDANGLINLQSQIPANYFPIAVTGNYNYVTTFFNGSNTQVQPYVKITNYDGTPRPNITVTNINVLCIKYI